MFIFQKTKLCLILTIAIGGLSAATVIPGASLLALSVNSKATFKDIRAQDMNYPNQGNITFTLGIGQGNLFNVYDVIGTDAKQFSNWLKGKLHGETKVSFLNTLKEKQPAINKKILDIYNGTATGCNAIGGISEYSALEEKINKNNAQIEGQDPQAQQLAEENEQIKVELRNRDSLIKYYKGIDNTIDNVSSSRTMWIASFPLLLIGLILLIIACTCASLWWTYKKREDDGDIDDYVDDNYDFTKW